MDAEENVVATITTVLAPLSIQEDLSRRSKQIAACLDSGFKLVTSVAVEVGNTSLIIDTFTS
jgi:hypothetical protein